MNELMAEQKMFKEEYEKGCILKAHYHFEKCKKIWIYLYRKKQIRN